MASCFFHVVVISLSTSSPFRGSRFHHLRNCSSLRASSAHRTAVNKMEPARSKWANLNQLRLQSGCQGLKVRLKTDSPGPSGCLKGSIQLYEVIIGARRLRERAVGYHRPDSCRPALLSARVQDLCHQTTAYNLSPVSISLV